MEPNNTEESKAKSQYLSYMVINEIQMKKPAICQFGLTTSSSVP